MAKKINVLQFICSSGFYGAERWVIALAKNMDSSRFRCDLAVTDEGEDGAKELVNNYPKDKGDIYKLKMRHRFDMKVIDELADVIKKKEIDIIHTHGYKSDIIGILAAKKAGIKVVVTPHGFSTNIDFKLKMFIWLGCRMFKHADKVVPLSQQLMADMRRFKVPEHKLVYVQNGVDLSEVEEQREKPNALREAAGERKRIGFIGQMIERKNIAHILEIFDDIASEKPDVDLYLLGDGVSREPLEQMTQSLKHKDRIEFLGFRDDRLEWLQSFDLFVMTSVLEGIPRCLMETMAMGVPVAAYDIAGVDQLVTHDQTGMLATLNDKETLKQHWLELLYNEEKAQDIVSNARQFVYDHFAASRMAREYEEVFEDLINNG